MQILVTGATGAIGGPLVQALMATGHDVLAATRRPHSYDGPGEAVAFDLDAGGRAAPLPSLDPDGRADDAEVAYYLVHALEQQDFGAIDRRRAERFAHWWGPDRTVVYLGGLGAEDTPSDHLRSRHEVGDILRTRCPTVELRASIVIGAASLSFRLLARLAELAGRLPVPVPAPAAAETLTQPIAEADLIELLVRAPELDPGTYDIGGPEVLSYGDLMERSARAQGLTLDVAPVVRLDPRWLGPATALAAGTDPWATSALFAGMATEAVVRKGHEVPGPRPATSLDDAIAAALAATRS